MNLSEGSLDGENAFSRFAENIGSLLYGGKKDALRSFVNDEKLEDEISNHYRASTVLSGAIWDVIRKLHTPYRDKLAKTKYKDFLNPQYSASGEPLADIARRIRTLLYRALDYLPGGEITLADYGRALILVDRIQFGPGTKVARSLEEVFQQRKIFKDGLTAQADDDPRDYPSLPEGGWSAMLASRQLQQEFVQNARAWLGIPAEVEFDNLTIEIQPKIDPPVAKFKFIEIEEFRKDPTAVLRILWNEPVDNIAGGKLYGVAPRRAKLIGTTVIIDCHTDRIVGRLSNASPTLGLYPDPAICLARENNIKAHNHETGLYLENCNIVRAGVDIPEGELISITGKVLQDTIILSGEGLSLHEGEFPAILITSP